MKVKPIRKNTDISDAMLDDFFKGDENYTGNVQAVEEERSEHDKHWNANMLVMQYSNENAEMRKVLQELVNIGYCHNFQDEYPYLVDWFYDVCGVIKKANELFGGGQNVKV